MTKKVNEVQSIRLRLRDYVELARVMASFVDDSSQSHRLDAIFKTFPELSLISLIERFRLVAGCSE